MIVLFTDFGLTGPYIGQVKAVLHTEAPEIPVIDLFSDAPVHDPKKSAYLLAAYADVFPPNTVFLGVVDPGVGGDRMGLAVKMGERWFVGPDNGLVELLLRREEGEIRCWRIDWKPDNCSASFHGRDVFSPIAAKLATGRHPDAPSQAAIFTEIDVDRIRFPDWDEDLHEIIYFDHFGNAMTGIRAEAVNQGDCLQIGTHRIYMAETFTSVASGDMFCYGNANGLMEIAVNRGRAENLDGFMLGRKISIIRQ